MLSATGPIIMLKCTTQSDVIGWVNSGLSSLHCCLFLPLEPVYKGFFAQALLAVRVNPKFKHCKNNNRETVFWK